jgi:hypothetical protein
MVNWRLICADVTESLPNRHAGKNGQIEQRLLEGNSRAPRVTVRTVEVGDIERRGDADCAQHGIGGRSADSGAE